MGSESIESVIESRLGTEPGERHPGLELPCSVTFEVDPIDILGWLKHQGVSPRVYWSNRNGEIEIGGRGVAMAIAARDPRHIEDRIAEIETLLRTSEPDPFLKMIGGRWFDALSAGDELWSEFPPLWFGIPEITLSRSRDEYHLTLTTKIEPGADMTRLHEKIRGILDSFSPDAPPFGDDRLPAIISRTDLPDRGGWTDNVNHLLKEIAGKNVEKVVLARRTDLLFSERLNPFVILARIKRKNPNCFTFLFEPRFGKAFIGASPERLFRVDGQNILSEAISGTTGKPRNGRSGDDGDEIPLYSEKNLLEHQYVLDDISSKIELLCDALRVSEERSRFELSNLSHIYSRIVGKLKPDISLSRIVSALHPTPAVGGTPREAALPIVRMLEPFERGWYASPVGVIGQHQTEMAVAIRSAVLEDDRAHLFAGAGIVPGSLPDEEWRELEHKISHSIEGLSGVLL